MAWVAGTFMKAPYKPNERWCYTVVNMPLTQLCLKCVAGIKFKIFLKLLKIMKHCNVAGSIILLKEATVLGNYVAMKKRIWFVMFRKVVHIEIITTSLPGLPARDQIRTLTTVSAISSLSKQCKQAWLFTWR